MSKKILPVFIGICVIAAVTAGVALGTGLYLTGRWGAFSGQIEAADALKKIPMVIGNWRAEREETLDDASITMLKIQDSYIYRLYRNELTGATVHLTLIVGQSGRISVHTPEVCFGGKNYEKQDNPASVLIPAAVNTVNNDPSSEKKELSDTFWKLDFVSNSLDVDNKRISFYYAVGTGGEWIATRSPRKDFRMYRYLYKIQVQAHSGESGSEDNVRAFLTDCLPVIHANLLPCR
ncbi:MAG: exosortase-associated EpsI family protein [Planctomycetaceae bacterium]|jgi:hypothetical protein|nr:exosortase-associated EpsI family protein [Planctomycetaceae bacterium]